MKEKHICPTEEAKVIAANALPGERFYFSPDLPSHYRVSDLGRILSLGRVLLKSDSRTKTVAPRVLKTPPNSNGYPCLYIRIAGEKKAFKLHQLVARCFLPNVPDKPILNHKDGNKLNSKADNLEWCNHSENLTHAYQNCLRKANTIPAQQARKSKKQSHVC